MHFFKGVSYHALPSSKDETSADISGERPFRDDEDAASSDSSLHLNDRRRAWKSFFTERPRSRSLYLILTVVNLFIFLSAVVLWTKSRSLETCLARTSSYSPALKTVKLHETDFANSFAEKSPYRGPPTVELEAAWEELWNQPEILIPPSGMARLNRTGELLSQYMLASPEEGNGYIGGLEVFHQIHCLDYIRQFTWYTMSHYSPTTTPLPKGFDLPLKALRMHTDHCIETLRLVLMCQSDVSSVLVRWSETEPKRPEADFNSRHMCRNFEEVKKWNRDNGLRRWGIEDVQHNHR